MRKQHIPAMYRRGARRPNLVLAASRQPAGRPRWFASRPRAPPYHDVSYPCWRRISPIAAASRGMTLLKPGVAGRHIDDGAGGD
jgi:hypothetical protein